MLFEYPSLRATGSLRNICLVGLKDGRSCSTAVLAASARHNLRQNRSSAFWRWSCGMIKASLMNIYCIYPELHRETVRSFRQYELSDELLSFSVQDTESALC